jgi:phosphotransacetylase
MPPLAAAIVHACDRESLQCALSGAFAGILAPVLVGPTSRIRATADAAGLDVSRLPIVDAPDDARASSLRAVELAAAGDVRALIRGALGIDELLAPVAAPERGLRGEHRLSHVHVLDLPGHAKPLLVADALLNFTPGLAAKRDILLNTLAFATALGMKRPYVALLAAIDVVSPAFASTADAALAGEPARASGAQPDAANTPDVLLAPNMECATLLVQTLAAVTGGLAAGLVVGARVPIVASSRSEGLEARLASCVLASLQAAACARRTVSPEHHGDPTARAVTV